jgi:hypothetical protein
LKTVKTLIIIVILAGAGLALNPYAFGQESKSAVQTIWDAIYDLQNKDQKLQAQIDDLKTESGPRQQIEAPSEVSAEIEIENNPSSEEMEIKVDVNNDGPERAAGVKLTIFYKMPLFDIDSIPEQCRNLERGIVQCDLGTIEAGDRLQVLISLKPKELGVQTTITADVSSTTEDRIPTNNHLVVDLVTGEGTDPENIPGEEMDATVVSDLRDEETTANTQNQTSSEQPSEDDGASTASSNEDGNDEEQAAADNEQTSDESASAGENVDEGESEETATSGSNQTSSENQGG